MALVWTAALMAQRIAVVDSNGSTSVYKTFQAAIEGAENGSVIYLPGGGFPIADSVKITKKLTIIGIGHKIKTENPDGYTTVSGNLFFNKDSDGSALLGCYVTGNVYIGNDGNEVDDVLIRCNNINQIHVGSKCLGTNVNQNYIRNGAEFNGTSAKLSNNITLWVHHLDDGFILNNIITGTNEFYDNGWRQYAIAQCHRTSINNNIIFSNAIYWGSSCWSSENMCVTSWGDPGININIGSVDWKNVFVNYLGIRPNSDFHFKDEYKQYDHKVGIYSGDGFSDDQLAPVPYIVAKSIPQQTDASGKLNIKIRVKAGE